MQPSHQHSRINITDLKSQIARKLGPERSKLYFTYLRRLFSLKLNKAELQKVCLRIVGRENIQLHNQLIRATLKNVFTSEVPPLLNEVEAFKASTAVSNKEPSIHAPLCNGDILPLSPRKARTGTRDRRAGDRCSALGPNGKTNFTCQQLPTTDSGDFNAKLENWESVQPDSQKLVHHRQGLDQYTDGEAEFRRNHPTKFPTLSAVHRFSAQSKDQKQLFADGDRKEVPPRKFLHPPLGIPFCAASIGGARRALTLASSSKVVSSIDIGRLLDITTLRERMELIAATQGLEGVSLDCANILNIALDVYLKGLIRSSIVLVESRSQHQLLNRKTQKHQAVLKLINNASPNPCQMQSSIRPTEVKHEHISGCSISMLDFRVAMELNPQRLGEDWPLLLEKICNRSSNEEEM